MTNLTNLPEVVFAVKDVGQIETNIITLYEAITKRKLAPGDPVKLFLLTIASVIAQQRVLIDYTGKQNLLAYAEGANLDHKGNEKQTPRLPAQAAVTTVRFLISPQTQVVTIPAGTRATPGGNLFFATESPVNVPASSTYIDIKMKCNIPGIVGNGWQPGQIKTLVDPLPWIQQIENITVSADGVDVEDDDSYRQRIHGAPEKYSVAGPDGAYIYWAKTAHQSIADVEPVSPSPGVVDLIILLENGEIPGSEILQLVEDICSDKTKRPLTDYVKAYAPEEMYYDIDFTYYINSEKAASVNIITEAVENAIAEYELWQKQKLGRDINPSEITRRVVNAGAKRVELVTPVYTKLNRRQVAKVQTISIKFGGLEDD